MLKIHRSKERNLDLICINHFEGLKASIIKSLKSSDCRFNKSIKIYIEKNLEALITFKPKDLLQIEKDLYSFIKKYRTDKKLIDLEFRKIFNYNAFIKRKVNVGWNPYKLAGALNIRTCLYCNRQYTFTIIEDGNQVTRPEFDHFFSQKAHPLLSLSFYNLIPSCTICNKKKGSKEFSLSKYLHPYENEHGSNAIFTWIPKNYRSLVGRANDLDIKIIERQNCTNKKAINRQNKVFKLENIFSEHSDYIQEIILKAHISKGAYLIWFLKLFKSCSKDELYRIAFGNYVNEKDFDKRVLAKLTFDVANELKLINP
ncbi:MAG: hypothetical protein H0V01_14980 [Bacteroidetes bacterium]|nr:hypothetical protein [Bacteroidota bacterium]HET6244654.1 hypothetical protein [Bacteroidia bacterium]